MSQWSVVAAGGVVIAYGSFSRRLSPTPVSGPLVFLVCGLAVGPLGLDLLSLAKEPHVTQLLLEGALVLLLFTDAAQVRARDLRREGFLPLRLLLIFSVSHAMHPQPCPLTRRPYDARRQGPGKERTDSSRAPPCAPSHP